jgi:hypothetical protein
MMAGSLPYSIRNMSAGKKKTQSKKPQRTAPNRNRAKGPVPVHGMEGFAPEDRAARSFSPADVTAFIKAAGIEPSPGPALDEVILRLERAVDEFLLSWRRNASSPSGVIQSWAHQVKMLGHEYLRIMRADPNDGRLAPGDQDTYLTLLRYPQLHDREGAIDERGPGNPPDDGPQPFRV